MRCVSLVSVCLASLLGVALVDGCTSTNYELSDAQVKDANVSAPLVSGDKLKQYIADIVSVRGQEPVSKSPFGQRTAYTRLNAAKYITDAFFAVGVHPVVEQATAFSSASSNIYFDIPGEVPDQVLLTAHYDSWYAAGADDNASAIAILLEAARVLKDTKPKRTIRIVAFDREEEGIIGSERYYAAHEADPIKLVINMDCMAYASDEPGSQDTPPGLALRDKGNFLAAFGNGPAEADLTRFVKLANLVPQPVDTLGLISPGDGHNAATGAFLQSDHVPVWRRGIPAIFLTDTALFRNHNYHTKDDLPETLNYGFLAGVGQLTVGAVAAFAETN